MRTRKDTKKGGKAVANVFDYFTLRGFLSEIRKQKQFTLRKLAESIGITPQAVNIAFNGGERLVINHLSGWKKAFKFKRMEGAYFELLAILAGYSSFSLEKRKRHMERAFNIIQRIIESEQQEHKPNALVYWISPESSLLRNMVKLKDFPENSEEIPAWVVNKVESYRIARGFSRSEFECRVTKVWKWLKKMEVVKFDTELKHWTRNVHDIFASSRISEDIEEFTTAILTLPHSDVHLDFASQVGCPAVTMNKTATLAIPNQIESLMRSICGRFFNDIVENLSVGCNKDEMDRLYDIDRNKYEQVKAYMQILEQYGFTVPTLCDGDFDTVVQLVYSMRKMTD